MQIAVIGVGTIGKTLAQKLHANGHQVRVANSRGSESLQDFARQTGVTAATAAEAVRGADVIILTSPLGKAPTMRAVFQQVPPGVIVVETMNYYPQRDGEIADLEQGMVHSAWVEQIIGRPVVKAFNNIGSFSLYTEGTPAYCTNLTIAEAQAARARAVRADAPANRDLVGQLYANLGPDYMQVLLSGNYSEGFVDHGVDINRAHFGLPPRPNAQPSTKVTF